MDIIIEKIIKFAEEQLKNNDSVQGFKHAKTTAKFAKILAEKENANCQLCLISAWLHDIGGRSVKETIEKNHGVTSAELSRDFLLSLKLSQSEVNIIWGAMSEHCFPNIQKTIISKILWDSDKLNIFSKEMENDYLNNWAIKLGNINKAKEQIKKEKEYYLKHFNTQTAKEIVSKILWSLS